MSVTVTRPLTVDFGGNANYLAPFDNSAMTIQNIEGLYATAAGYNRRVRPNKSFTSLSRVVVDLYPEDEMGVAYPAGQLWICDFANVGDAAGNSQETYTLASGSIVGSFGSKGTAYPVPSSIDTSKYTVNNDRNNRPIKPIINQYPGPTPPSSTHVTIRTTDNMYAPMDLDGRSVWAPCLHSVDTLPTGNCVEPAVGPTDYPGPDVPWTGGWHPGYRSVRVVFTSSVDPAAMPLLNSLTVKIYEQQTTKTGTLLLTSTIGAGSLTYNATWGAYVADMGVIGSLMSHPHGRVRNFICYFSFDSGGMIVSPLTVLSCFVYASARIDIPACWTSTYDNLVVPGGILKGTVPGF